MFAMCRVKEGAAVVTSADLQNLVTSIILRQTSTFSAQDIFANLQSKLVGSQFLNSQEARRRCDETIETLHSVDYLRAIDTIRYKLTMSFPSVTRF